MILQGEAECRAAQLGEKKAWGDLSMYKVLMGGNEDEEVNLFLVPIDRTRGNGHKLKHMKSHLITSKLFFFFCYEGGQHGNRLSREVVQAPSAEILETQLNSLATCFSGCCLSRGVGLDDLRRSLPT